MTRSPFHAQTIAAAQRRDELAELVAHDATRAGQGCVMGVSGQRAGQMWKRICTDLGESVTDA